MRTLLTTSVLVGLCATLNVAHEVPPMTGFELAKAREARLRITQAQIRSVSRWAVAVEQGKVTDKKTRTLREDYDADGDLVGVVSFKDGAVSQETKFTFNAAHQMLTDTDYDGSGQMTEQIRYEYSDHGLVKRGTMFGGDGRIKEQIVYTFDPDRIVVERRSADGAQRLQTTTYRYARPSAVADYTGAEQVGADGTRDIAVIQRLDDQHRILEKQVDFADDTKSYVWLYSDFSRHNRWSRISKQMKHGGLEYHEDYRFDAFGNPTEIRRVNRDNVLIAYTEMSFERAHTARR